MIAPVVGMFVGEQVSSTREPQAMMDQTGTIRQSRFTHFGKLISRGSRFPDID